MKRHGRPHVLVIDELRSCGAAMRDVGNADKQETGRWFNNRAENSHQPFRRRARAMHRFRGMRSLQMFASVQASVFSDLQALPTSHAVSACPLEVPGKEIVDPALRMAGGDGIEVSPLTF